MQQDSLKALRDDYREYLRDAEKIESLLASAETSAALPTSTALEVPLTEAAQLALAGFDKIIFRPITVDPKKPLDWRAVLDGSPLTPTHAAHGLIIPRRVSFYDHEMYERDFAEWLASQRGRTVFLDGAAGDGKSSYLSKLAVDSIDTHIFLRWSSDLPPDFGMLESYRQSVEKLLENQAVSGMPTIILVYTLRPYYDELTEQRLVASLKKRQEDGDGIVVLIDGRIGDLDRISGRLGGDCVSLERVNHREASEFIKLIRDAYEKLKNNGLDEQAISLAYPNLLNFFDLNEDSRVKMLTDESSFLVVLLRAVYGKDMWVKVHEELKLLEEKDPKDAMAYFHVCLATVMGATLPYYIIDVMTPGVDLDARSNHNPWVRREEDDTHEARHQIIAQVVLEKSAKRKALFDQCIFDYTSRLRVRGLTISGEFLDRLGQIAAGVSSLLPISTDGDINALRSNLLRALRNNLLSVDGLAQIIVGRSKDDYWAIAKWILILVNLVPSNSHHLPHLKLLDAADALLETARRTPNCPSEDQNTYYQAKLHLRRQRLANECDFELLRETVRNLSGFIGSDWCGTDFYIDLFWWTFKVLEESFPDGPFEDQNAIEGEALFLILFTVYERIRSRVTSDVMKRKGISAAHTKMIRHLVNYRLPDKKLKLVEHSWQVSIALGNPNSETAALYADMLLAGVRRGQTVGSNEILTTASEVLVIAAKASPDLTEVLLFMAIIEKQYKKRVVDNLDERVKSALALDPAGLNEAFALHAAALIEDSPSRKIELLKSAIHGYERHKDKGPYQYQRVQFAWDLACKEIQNAGASDWQRYRREYDKVYIHGR